LGLYEKAMPPDFSIEQKLECVKHCGFDYLELSVDETEEKLNRLDWSESEIDVVIAAVCRTGVPIATMCLSGHRKYPIGSADGPTRERGMEILQNAVKLAEVLGIRIIQLAGYDVYYEPSTPEAVTRFAENLRLGVEFAASHGVILAFETMETEFLNTVGKAMAHVKTLNSPYLQVYPDSGNLNNAAIQYGTSLKADLESGRGHIAALHLKETVPGVFRDIVAGEGQVDFQTVIQTAYGMGVRMYTAEMWYKDAAWKDNIRKTRDLFSRLLDEAAAIL